MLIVSKAKNWSLSKDALFWNMIAAMKIFGNNNNNLLAPINNYLSHILQLFTTLKPGEVCEQREQSELQQLGRDERLNGNCDWGRQPGASSKLWLQREVQGNKNTSFGQKKSVILLFERSENQHQRRKIWLDYIEFLRSNNVNAIISVVADSVKIENVTK